MLLPGQHYIRRFQAMNRRRRAIIAFIVLYVLEEYFIGCIRVMYRNMYSQTVYIPITVKRRPDAPRIAIVSITYDASTPAEYSLSEATVSCYAILHNYTLIRLNLQEDNGFTKACPGKDPMFRRHCVMARLMRRETKFDWFLFVDADMGVVNPNHLIEEYIDQNADLIFYDRLYNYEIMAGSYLARNTRFAREFLYKWSLYEQRVVFGSFQAVSTDNGAIHEVILDEFCSDCSVAERRRCIRIWEESNWYPDLFMYETCARLILGIRNKYQNENGTLRQLSNAAGYWARDGWQTDNRWSGDDFIVHGWKESTRNHVGWSSWLSPFAKEEFDPKTCSNKTVAHFNWAYKDSFIKPKEEIRHELQAVFRRSYLEHLRRAYIFAKFYSLNE